MPTIEIDLTNLTKDNKALLTKYLESNSELKLKRYNETSKKIYFFENYKLKFQQSARLVEVNRKIKEKIFNIDVDEIEKLYFVDDNDSETYPGGLARVRQIKTAFLITTNQSFHQINLNSPLQIKLFSVSKELENKEKFFKNNLDQEYDNIINITGWQCFRVPIRDSNCFYFGETKTIAPAIKGAIVFPHIKGEDLFYFLKGFRNNEDSLYNKKNNLLKICGKIAKKLEIFHEKGFVHQDIKLENIIINSQGEINLIDLASAIKLENLKNFNKNAQVYLNGTLDYLPMEYFTEKYNISAAADVYALGVVCLLVLTQGIGIGIGKNEQKFFDVRAEGIRRNTSNDVIVEIFKQNAFKRNTKDFKLIEKHYGKECANYLAAILSDVPNERPKTSGIAIFFQEMAKAVPKNFINTQMPDENSTLLSHDQEEDTPCCYFRFGF